MELPLRISLVPVTPALAAMLLEDPVQLEEALCVAYDAPPIEGEWAERLRSQRDRPATESSSPMLWLIRIRSEDTLIGWVTTESTTESTASVAVCEASSTARDGRVKFELSPAYQDVGYESELAQLVNHIPKE